jgi:hypothetical protein
MTRAFVAEHIGLIILVLSGAAAFLLWQHRAR